MYCGRALVGSWPRDGLTTKLFVLRILATSPRLDSKSVCPAGRRLVHPWYPVCRVSLTSAEQCRITPRPLDRHLLRAQLRGTRSCRVRTAKHKRCFFDMLSHVFKWNAREYRICSFTHTKAEFQQPLPVIGPQNGQWNQPPEHMSLEYRRHDMLGVPVQNATDRG